MNSVAINGIRGSYGEEAAREIVGARAKITECADFEETFQAVLSGKTECAVVPLENKIVGVIESAKRIFDRTNLRIFGELVLKIDHVLIGTAEADLERLRTVCSHEEAIKQCRRFLSANDSWEIICGADTASSVRQIVAENNFANAAIGSRRAAEIYCGKVLRENISDETDNWTKFFLIGR